MLRFLSFLVFLAGVAAAALGAVTYFKIDVSEYLPAGPQPVAERIVDYGEAPEAIIEEAAAPMEIAAPEPVAIAAPEPAPVAAPAPEPILSGTPTPMPSLSSTPAKAPQSAPQPMKSRSLARSVSVPVEEVVLATQGVGLEFATESAAPMRVGPTAEETFLASLKTVPVAHQTPRHVEYMRPFDVVLSIDATGDDSATDSLSGDGVIVESEAKVSDKVEARLNGAHFTIEANSPATQNLSPLTENTWRWAVTPLTTGEHELVFEVFAIDQDEVTPLRTFRDRVTVQVSGLNKAIAMANEANPIFILLGGIGSALGGLWGTIKFFGKN